MSILFDCAGKIPMAEGGEGIIYEDNGQIIKLYKQNVNLKAKQNKIQLLLKKSLPAEAIAPKDTVVDRNGNFIGFSMDKAEGEEFKKLTNRKFLTANNITTKDILALLVKTQKTMETLHRSNIFIGDLNDRNLLFDKQYHIYFIDCDSWTVENEKCSVAMDLFKDPLLRTNDFNSKTDTYAFAVLAWKLLTRIHPFGGTMNPDMNIVDRMRKGISVIDNPKVMIPRTIKPWKNLSPDFIRKMQSIFKNQCRELSDELDDMLQNLKFCDVDKEYYYGRYSACPLCNADAKVEMTPISKGIISGLKIAAVLNADDIKTVMDENTYLDNQGDIVDIRSGQKVKYQYGVMYYFTDNGYFIEDMTDRFVVHSEKEYRIEKKYKSRIVVEGNHIYFISRQNSFTDMTVLKMGNSIKPVCKCSNTSYFEVKGGNYCIVNYYHGKLILNSNGMNTEIKYDSDIINYGIHYDEVSTAWLLLLEDNSGRFRTYIVKKGEVVFETGQIRYECRLSSPCIGSGTLYIPTGGKIRGFSYKKSAYKDFECDAVDEGSKLIKKKNRFVIVNDDNIYLLN